MLISFLESAAFQDVIEITYIGFVIHDDPFNLDPSMGAEGQYLYTDDHLCGPAKASKQDSGRSRPLQAKHLFEIEDACQVNRSAELCDRGWLVDRRLPYLFLANDRVQPFEVICSHGYFKAKHQEPASPY
jgi:hypothetical protein